MSKNIEEGLFDLISSQLGVKKENIKSSNHLIKDLKGDSLDLVEIILSVEEKWSISIPDESAEKIETVQNLIDYIKSKT